MQHIWLNKQNNKNLIVFFAGWSFDFKPFEFLECEDNDVLFVYDYNELNCAEDFEKYEKKYLITWSMGTFVAYLLKDLFKRFDKKISINGTPHPVDDEFGIPFKPFLLTLRHARTGLEGKFYQNIFSEDFEYERYLKNPVAREIENRENELKALYEKIKSTNTGYEKFYDYALISLDDKIIPTKNQINFWQKNAKYLTIESGHFPFYNFEKWNDIIKLAE